MSLFGDSVIEVLILATGAIYGLAKYLFPDIDRVLPTHLRRGLPVVAWLVTVGAGVFLGFSLSAQASSSSDQTLRSEIEASTETVSALQRRIESLGVQVEKLTQENQSLVAEKNELERELSRIRSQVVEEQTQPEDVTTSPPPANSALIQRDDETTYTITKAINESGTITVFMTVLNEGQETSKCLSKGSVSMFDSQGNSRRATTVIANGETKDISSYGRGCYALPSRIAREIGLVFSGLSPNEDLIQELRLQDMRFRQVPVPYEG